MSPRIVRSLEAAALAPWLVWVALLGALGAGSPPEPPVLAEVRAAHRPSDVSLLDRNGELLQTLRLDPRGRRLEWTPLAEVSPALVSAVVASEDRRFRSHHGVDWRAVAAAAAARLTGGAPRGASTITMQLVGLLDPGLGRPDGGRTLAQKWRQMRLALALERRWTKDEVLEAYLNLVAFRGEVDGVTAAAAVLFGKASHGLTEAEAAVLAALVRSPNAARGAVVRRARPLAVTAPAAEVAAAAVRALAPPRGMAPRAGLAPHAAQRLLAGAAGPVRSTLDADLQRVAAESLARHLLGVRERHVRDGAVLVVDNASGEVLAYVGGTGALASARHVDGIRARRQAGSALKPFLYALAFERRLLTPASLLEDTPLDVAVQGGSVFRPRNYDESFRGLVSARTALASSLNVPAVRTLDLVGTDLFVERLKSFGFEGLTESGDYYGPSLALGSGDVSLWEMVNAYRTLANGGQWSPLRLTPEAAASGARRRVTSAEAAFLVAHILADRASRSPTFGLESPLATRFWTAVKTGTSQEMRDNWCVGFSRRFTVGVWVGNFSGEPMRDVSGVTGAAPVWLDVMAALHRATPSAPPPAPPGLVAARASFPAALEPARREWFLTGTEPLAAGAALAATSAPGRIVHPVAGTIIAIDPDIPADRQRVVFEAAAAGPAARWLLDGALAGAAARPLVWAPQPGRHVLVLADGEGRTLDEAAFLVRGAPGDGSE